MTKSGNHETRLVNRRCRCGSLLIDHNQKCQWHAAASAKYASDLLLYLATVPPRRHLPWRRLIEFVTRKKTTMNVYMFEYVDRERERRAEIPATNSLDAFDAFRADHPFVPIANVWVETFGS